RHTSSRTTSVGADHYGHDVVALRYEFEILLQVPGRLHGSVRTSREAIPLQSMLIAEAYELIGVKLQNLDFRPLFRFHLDKLPLEVCFIFVERGGGSGAVIHDCFIALIVFTPTHCGKVLRHTGAPGGYLSLR